MGSKPRFFRTSRRIRTVFHSRHDVALHFPKVYRSMIKSHLQSQPDCGMNINKLLHDGRRGVKSTMTPWPTMLSIISQDTTVFEAPESRIHEPSQASWSLTGRVISSFVSWFADSISVWQSSSKSSQNPPILFPLRLETHQGHLSTNGSHLSTSNTFLDRIAELSGTDFWGHIFSPNVVLCIRVDEVIQIQLVQSLSPLHPEVHESGLWFVDVHAIFDLVEYPFHGIFSLALGISCDKVVEELAKRFFRNISRVQIQLPSAYKVEYGFGDWSLQSNRCCLPGVWLVGVVLLQTTLVVAPCVKKVLHSCEGYLLVGWVHPARPRRGQRQSS